MVTKFSGMPEHGTSRTPVQMEGGRSGSRNGKYRMVASNCHRYDWISLAWISAERDPDRHAPHLLHLQVEVAGLLAILGRDLDGPVTVRCMSFEEWRYEIKNGPTPMSLAFKSVRCLLY